MTFRNRSTYSVPSQGRVPFLIFCSLVVGAAKANEVLIWGKKKDAQELLDCGFIK